MSYIPVIGLEIHAELLTNSKIFCSCSAEFGGEQNARCCPGCSSMPGTLPVLNQTAVKYAIKAGLAMNCDINKFSVFDRKTIFILIYLRHIKFHSFTFPFVLMGISLLILMVRKKYKA